MLKEIKLDNLVVRQNQFLTSDMDGDRVMMSIESGKYYNLGGIGGRIWDMMESPVTIQGIVDQLLQEYDVDKVTCEQQVLRFIQQMYTENMIMPVDEEYPSDHINAEKVGEY